MNILTKYDIELKSNVRYGIIVDFRDKNCDEWLKDNEKAKKTIEDKFDYPMWILYDYCKQLRKIDKTYPNCYKYFKEYLKDNWGDKHEVVWDDVVR